MGQNGYEFRYVSKKQRLSMIAWRSAFFFLFVAAQTRLMFGLVADPSAQLKCVAYSLVVMFAYLNLLTVKIEIMELFEPPYTVRNTEILALAAIIFVYSFSV